MKLDGACHCGAIRFEAEGDADAVSICHCTDCQALTGTAFRVTIGVSDRDFRLLQGRPKLYVKTAENGNQREQYFCGDCGSPIYTTSVGPAPKEIGIRIGTLAQRRALTPRRQIWHDSSLPFVAHLFDDLPASAGE